MPPVAEGSPPVCLVTPVKSKLYFRKHMLRGSGWPGELITVSGEMECPGPALTESGEGPDPQWKTRRPGEAGQARTTAARQRA